MDVLLFPLDTLKTRLQSNVGFRAAGGFSNIYAGIGPAALASAPSGEQKFCQPLADRAGWVHDLFYQVRIFHFRSIFLHNKFHVRMDLYVYNFLKE